MLYITLMTGPFLILFVIGIMLFASRLIDKKEEKNIAEQRRGRGPKD